MNQWSILDIDPTDDISAIKKAYAQKLRIYHPEVNPEGYQNLRQAYNNALKYAKNMDNRVKEPSHDIHSPENLILDEQLSSSPKDLSKEEPEFHYTHRSHHSIILSEDILQQPPSLEQQNVEFISQVEALYNDFFSRIKIDNWKVLLNSDVMWNINNRKNLSKIMLDFLFSHHYLPQDIWKLLDSNFNWCDNENSTYQFYYNQEFINYIRLQIKQATPLSFSFFKAIKGVDYEKFLENRENAQNAFTESNISAANLYIERAKRIYPDDPDLLRLEGKIQLRSGNIDGAISIFNDLLGINPNDLEAFLYRATAYYENNQVQKSIEDYYCVYSRIPDSNELPLLMAKSYFKLDELEKAKHWAMKALKTKYSNNEAKSLLSQIYARIRSNLIKELEKDPSNNELKLKLDVVNSEVFKNNKKSGEQNSNSNSINPETITKFLKILFKIMLYIVLIFVCFAVIYVTKIGLIVIIIYFIRHFLKKKTNH